MFSVPCDTVLVEVKNFVYNHYREIIILDFNHFYDMGPELHRELIGQIHAILGDILVPKSKTPHVTPGELWATKQRVIVTYDNEISGSYPDIWAGNAIASPWPNTTKTDELQQKLTKWIQERDNDVFLVTQGVCTPDTDMVAKTLVPGSHGNISSLANAVTPQICQWIRSHWSALPLNIVIVDCFHVSEFIDACVQMNAR